MSTFLVGYFLGIATLAAAADLRRALRSAQKRDQSFQERANRIGGDHGV